MREKIGVAIEDRVQIANELMGLRDDVEDEADFNYRRDVLLGTIHICQPPNDILMKNHT